jgi:hypothetical protein
MGDRYENDEFKRLSQVTINLFSDLFKPWSKMSKRLKGEFQGE